MPGITAIQIKALFMLVTFTASFTVFCHCAKAAVPACCHSACCEKHQKHEKKADKPSDSQDCQGMHAVKFNLLEKLTADNIHAAPTPLTAILQKPLEPGVPAFRAAPKKPPVHEWSYKHSPPDRQSLYQCFLI